MNKLLTIKKVYNNSKYYKNTKYELWNVYIIQNKTWSF